MPITFDAAYRQATPSDTSWDHTVGVGSYKILLVMCGMHNADNITAVTFNGVPLTKLGESSGSYRRAQIWYLLDPPVGTYTVQLTRSGTSYNVSAGSVSFFGVSQTSPFRDHQGEYGTTYSPDITVASLSDDVVVDCLATWTWSSNSPGAGQSLHWFDNHVSASMRSSSSRKDGGDPSTTMSWTGGAGGDGNYAYYAASLITQPGFEGENNLPSLTINAGSNGLAVDLPALSINSGIDGAAFTLPLAYILESWVEVPYSIVDASLPAFVGDGEAKTGTVSIALLTLPSWEIIAFGVSDIWDLVNTVEDELPLFTIEATMLTGEAWEGDVDIPLLTISAAHKTGTISRGTLNLPIIEMVGQPVNRSNLDSEISVFTIQGYSHGPLISELDENFPLLEIAAYLEREQDGFRVYVLNTKNGAITEYENFEFNSFCTFKGKHLGANSDGIMALEGADDNGTAIDASFKIGITNFRLPNIKKITDAYLSVKGEGGLVLTVISDDGLESGYPVHIATARARPAKVHLGKGRKGVNWQIALENIAGGDFELSGIDLNVELLKRNI